MELREINGENYQAVVRLTVAPGQEHYVADNRRSLMEAQSQEGLFPMAIYREDTVVGFLLYDYDPDIPGWSLSRFMIGAEYQGRGYGKEAVRTFLSYFRKTHNSDGIYISVSLDNTPARRMYAALGFRELGEISYTYEGYLYREMRMVLPFPDGKDENHDLY